MYPTLSLRRVSGTMLLLAGLALLFLYASGCDSVTDPETIVLNPEEQTFEFVFNGSQLTAGTAFTVESTNQVDLSDELLNAGFQTSEVVSATVTAVELNRTQPLDVNLQSIASASFSLRAGSQTTEVASKASFGSTTRDALNVQTGLDVGTFVRRPAFTGVLRFTPSQVSNAQYRLTVTVRFRVEVEGV